jgi:Lrp/AsnC family leucine-responsive transcriptional regulator
MKFDKLDMKILELLEKDGRISYAAIAKEVGLTSTAIGQRVQKLIDEKIILGFSTRLNREQLGDTIQAIISLKLNFAKLEAFNKILNSFREIEYCYRVTGEDCMVMKVNFKDNNHLLNFINKISIYGVTKSSIIIDHMV